MGDQAENFSKIKQLEHEQQLQKADFVKQRLERQASTDREVDDMVKRIDQLQEDNKNLESAVKKAAEVQKRYLQACQDIIAFWINMGKMYGTELADMLRPSVNNPIEVLRALDTVLSVIYPDAAKSQENFKKIAASCSSVWSKLLVNAPNSDELRSDFECILMRACQYYKNSQFEIKKLT